MIAMKHLFHLSLRESDDSIHTVSLSFTSYFYMSDYLLLLGFFKEILKGGTRIPNLLVNTILLGTPGQFLVLSITSKRKIVWDPRDRNFPPLSQISASAQTIFLHMNPMIPEFLY